jgi:hypothetical protein
MTLIVPQLMRDSTNASLIPVSTPIVAGYIDGDYAWTEEDWNRFPDAEKILITVNGDLRANVCDVENGAMTFSDFTFWVRSKQDQGMDGATGYWSRDRNPAPLGVAYYWWCADWTNQPHRVPGAAAVQWQNMPEQEYDNGTAYDQVWLDKINAANRPWPL